MFYTIVGKVCESERETPLAIYFDTEGVHIRNRLESPCLRRHFERSFLPLSKSQNTEELVAFPKGNP
jgi:hypothetical protein